MDGYEMTADVNFMMALDFDFDDDNVTLFDKDEADRSSIDIHYNGYDTQVETGVDSELASEDGMDSPEDFRLQAIEDIEKLILSFLSQLNASVQPHSEDTSDDEDEPSQTRTRKAPGKKIEICLADRKKTTADGSMGTRSVRYPLKGKNSSAKPIAQLLRVLDLMHEALVKDVPTTKRDMFYKDVPLFKTQAVVDRLVDDIAATFDLERSDLNVRASSKGLVCGSGLTIHLVSGERVTANDSEGALIPVGEDIARFEVAEELGWVLIVEKEAVFQTLCRLRLTSHAALPSPGLIITGKGYPDVATRQVVKTLADNLPAAVPILALVDGDAYGIDILSVYVHGSRSMRHEQAKLAAGGRINGIGVWPSELSGLDVDRDTLLVITKYDEKKAYEMLSRPTSVMSSRWRKELTYMLHTRRKAEIEVLREGLEGYLLMKIGGAVREAQEGELM